ncbi:MAG: adenylosuccinate synthetase [Parcubacteria group bacterium]|nr:adenylosuccinate synthetase [Parcubacteria group bacterium]
MSVTAVIGLQWGDEGKGKVVDNLARDADFVIRFHGGANAGHTVINKYGKFPLHLIPSGIFNPRAKCVITNGVVLDPGVLKNEIALLAKFGIKLNNRFFISPWAHVVLEKWKVEDQKWEARRGKKKLGTTGKGIGPTYAAKALRHGVRVCDFVKTREGRFLKPYVKETFSMLREALAKKKRILAEGAHGVLLDIDWGTYPYVTSSNIVPGALHAAAGIPPQEITRVIGVAKAYQTRVGAGPMPTELKDDLGNLFRERGYEFGTTTGRPRRCGWLDLEALKFACDLVSPTSLALTKLDVLDGFREIKVGISYHLGRKKVSFVESSTEELGRMTVKYQVLPGWEGQTVRVRKVTQLPKEARHYLEFVENFVGVSIRLVSVGPKRGDTLEL